MVTRGQAAAAAAAPSGDTGPVEHAGQQDVASATSKESTNDTSSRSTASKPPTSTATPTTLPRANMTPTLTTGTSTSTSTPTLTSTASMNMSMNDDLFARAQAMGLRMTREEYERTRAGVTAFLRGDQSSLTSLASPVLSATGTPLLSATAAGGLSPALSATTGVSPRLGDDAASSSAATTQSGQRSTMLGFSAYKKSESSPLLSFYSASIIKKEGTPNDASSPSAAQQQQLQPQAQQGGAAPTTRRSPLMLNHCGNVTVPVGYQEERRYAQQVKSGSASSSASAGAGAKEKGEAPSQSSTPAVVSTPKIVTPSVGAKGQGSKASTAAAPAQEQANTEEKKSKNATTSEAVRTPRQPETAQAQQMEPPKSVSLEEKANEAERRLRREKKRRRLLKEQQRLQEGGGTPATPATVNEDGDAEMSGKEEKEVGHALPAVGLGIDVLANDNNSPKASLPRSTSAYSTVGDDSLDSISSFASSNPAATPVTPSMTASRRGSSNVHTTVRVQQTPSSTASDDQHSTAGKAPAPARAWVSPGGTMKMVQFTVPRSPKHLAGAGAEDSPAVGAGPRFAGMQTPATGGSTGRRVLRSQTQKEQQERAGSSSPMVESLVSSRAANDVKTPEKLGASPQQQQAGAEKQQGGEEVPQAANDSGVFFDQLRADEEMNKAPLRSTVNFPRSASTSGALDGEQNAAPAGTDRARLDSTGSAASDGAGDVSDAQASAFLLQEEMGKMSFLDKVMQHKTSPVRLRKEAKAKEKAERQMQEAQMEMLQAHHAQFTPGDLGHGSSKSVRWASSVYSPASLAAISNSHQRFTTREHYDFIHHGIHPSYSDLEGGSGLTSLTPSMISAPWPEAHVEMLANMSAQRASENGEPVVGRNGVSISSPMLRQMQSHSRSTRDEDSSSVGEGLGVMTSGASSPFGISTSLNAANASRPSSRHGRTRTTSGRKGILLQSPGTNISPSRVMLPPGSPIRTSLAFFSASPPKPGKAWAPSALLLQSSTTTPSLSAAPFGRVGTSSLSEVISAERSPSAHSRESTHQSRGSAADSGTNDSIPGSTHTHSANTSPLLYEDAQADTKPISEDQSVTTSPQINDDPQPASSSAQPSSSTRSRRREKAKKAPEPIDERLLGTPAKFPTLPAPGLVRAAEWDRSDGSRVVKLVSEELQLGLDKGAIAKEPPMRYYVLPPGFGKSRQKPTAVSYAGMIGQAILTASDGRLSLAEIYAWINTTYPYFQRGDRGWQNSIRHNLSLNKSFYKIEREAGLPGKGGWWAIEPGHEDRFCDGTYTTTPSKEAVPTGNKHGKNPKTPTASRTSSSAVPLTGSSAMSVDPVVPSSAISSGSQRRKRRSSDAGQEVDDEAPQTKGSKSTKRAKVAEPSKSRFVESSPASPAVRARRAATSSHAAQPVVTPMRPARGYATEGSAQSTMPMLTDSASSPPSSPYTRNMSLLPSSGQEYTKGKQITLQPLNASKLSMNAMYSSVLPPSPEKGGGEAQEQQTGTPGEQSQALPSGSAPPSSAGSSRNVFTTTIPRAGKQRAYRSYASQQQEQQPQAQQGQMPPPAVPTVSPENQQSGLIMMMDQSPGPGASRMAAMMRGSPVRGGGQTYYSPARSGSIGSAPVGIVPMNAVMTSSAPFHKSLSVPQLGSNTPARVAVVPPGSASRFTATPSPMRRGLSTGSMSSANATPWLEDPFDYQATLQHELDFTMQSLEHPHEFTSPMRVMWTTDATGQTHQLAYPPPPQP